MYDRVDGIDFVDRNVKKDNPVNRVRICEIPNGDALQQVIRGGDMQPVGGVPGNYEKVLQPGIAGQTGMHLCGCQGVVEEVLHVWQHASLCYHPVKPARTNSASRVDKRMAGRSVLHS
jgi:hypothetical protein